jgi:hypothetical protein
MELRESTMKHINVDNQSEEVKHFLRSLDVDPEGSVLELNGKELLHVAPMESIPLEPEDVTSIQRGIEQMAAGMGRAFDSVDADIRKSLGMQPRR